MGVLIVGGRGFAGQALAAHLHQAGRSGEVAVVSRSAEPLDGVARLFTGHFGALAGMPEFRRALNGFSAVVHLADGLAPLQRAARAQGLADAEPQLQASERLASAAREAGVPLFVYVSSLKAICDEEDERLLTEACASRASTLYGHAKLQLELRIAAALAGSATALVIVRNPVTYGPSKHGSLQRLLRLADTPWPLPFASIANRRSLLAVENLASALAAVIATAGSSGPSGVFHIHDGPAPSTSDIVGIFRDALGRSRRLFSIGAAGQRLARRLPLLAPAARRLYGSLQLSDAHFRDSFAWSPQIDSKTALAAMAGARGASRRPQ
jgi:UDP-glucose 4-epimerase